MATDIEVSNEGLALAIFDSERERVVARMQRLTRKVGEYQRELIELSTKEGVLSDQIRQLAHIVEARELQARRPLFVQQCLRRFYEYQA